MPRQAIYISDVTLTYSRNGEPWYCASLEWPLRGGSQTGIGSTREHAIGELIRSLSQRYEIIEIAQ